MRALWKFMRHLDNMTVKINTEIWYNMDEVNPLSAIWTFFVRPKFFLLF